MLGPLTWSYTLQHYMTVPYLRVQRTIYEFVYTSILTKLLLNLNLHFCYLSSKGFAFFSTIEAMRSCAIYFFLLLLIESHIAKFVFALESAAKILKLDVISAASFIFKATHVSFTIRKSITIFFSVGVVVFVKTRKKIC